MAALRRAIWLTAPLLALVVAPATAEGADSCPEKAPDRLVTLTTPGSRLTATIAPGRGGEMVSLRLSGDADEDGKPRELLYRGGNFCADDGFDGKAPILWPATGRTYLPDAPGQKPRRGWLWKGKVYPMPLHGFARDLPWRVVGESHDASEASVTLELDDSEATRKLYPFGFTFQLRYILRGDAVSVEHHIRAAGNNPGAMPFSLGNHIAFALPPSGATLTSAATRRLLLDGEARPTGQSEKIAPLARASLAPFSRGPAVPLAGYDERPAARLHLANGLSITVEHHGNPTPAGEPVGFNMWGDAAKSFFSPEPWWGKQNALATGDGVNWIEPGGTFEWTFDVQVEAGERKNEDE